MVGIGRPELFPQARLLVFAKAPEPGRVKTRLIPVLGPQGAASLHRRLVHHTLSTTQASETAPVELYCSPDIEHPFFRSIEIERGIPLRRQQGQDLGERMASAFAEALARHAYVVLVGTDCPALDAQTLQRSFDALREGSDVVLCPAEDGGYVLIGLRRVDKQLFEGVPWGSSHVLRETRDRLRALNWQWRELPSLWDVDRPEDLARLQASQLLPAPDKEPPCSNESC